MARGRQDGLSLRSWRLRGRAAIPTLAPLLVRSRLVIVVRRFSAACGSVFSHVLEALSHAPGKGAAVRRTRPRHAAQTALGAVTLPALDSGAVWRTVGARAPIGLGVPIGC
jgi:hypothetical protein